MLCDLHSKTLHGYYYITVVCIKSTMRHGCSTCAYRHNCQAAPSVTHATLHHGTQPVAS